MFLDTAKRKRRCICCGNTIPSKVQCVRTNHGKLHGGSICYMCFVRMIENIEGGNHNIKRFCHEILITSLSKAL